MPLYEVFVPARPGSGAPSLTVKVEASSWLLALRAGIKQIGEQGTQLSSVLCENQPDGSIVVKDPVSRRVFRIKELAADAAAEAARAEAHRQTAEQERLGAKKLMELRAQAAQKLEEKRRSAAEAEHKAKQERASVVGMRAMAPAGSADESAEEQARKAAVERALKAEQDAKRAAAERAAAEAELKRREAEARAAAEAAALKEEGFAEEVGVETADAELEKQAAALSREMEAGGNDDADIDSRLTDAFEATMDLFSMDDDRAVEHIMDLALRFVPAEAGSIILSDVNSRSQDMYFLSARGPVKDQVMKLRIPRGRGIVGFSINHNTSLAVNDVSKDPNFFAEIAKRTGFPTYSLLCVPISGDGRTLGALQLVNKKGSHRWSAGEVNLLKFLADKAADHLLAIADRVDISDIQ